MTWFTVLIEMNLVFVPGGIEIDLFFKAGIGIDLTPCCGRNFLGLCEEDRS